jgi:hypothetical protein
MFMDDAARRARNRAEQRAGDGDGGRNADADADADAVIKKDGLDGFGRGEAEG